MGVLRGCTSKRRRLSLTEVALTVELVVSRCVICNSVSPRDNSVLSIVYLCAMLFSLVGPVELSFSCDNCGRCKMYVAQSDYFRPHV